MVTTTFPVRLNSRNQYYLTRLKADRLAPLVMDLVLRNEQISLEARAPLCKAEAIGAQPAL